MNPFIIRNQIRTPDGTILESTHVHDYVEYEDKNGELYSTDGGDEYIHRSINKEPYEDMTVYSNAPIETIREIFKWGTRGVKGDKPLRWVLLRDMTNLHIESVIDYLQPYPKEVSRNIDLFRRELEYREKNGISVTVEE